MKNLIFWISFRHLFLLRNFRYFLIFSVMLQTLRTNSGPPMVVNKILDLCRCQTQTRICMWVYIIQCIKFTLNGFTIWWSDGLQYVSNIFIFQLVLFLAIQLCACEPFIKILLNHRMNISNYPVWRQIFFFDSYFPKINANATIFKHVDFLSVFFSISIN